MRAGLMSSTVMLTVVGAAVLLAAPKPKNITAIATFRGAPGDGAHTTDNVPVAGTIAGSGGFFDAYVTPTATSPVLQLSLLGLVVVPDTVECDVPGVLAGCNPTRYVLGNHLSLDDFNFRVKPVVDNAPDFDDLPGGLTGMACGPSSIALVNYTAWVDGTEGHWGLNANPRYHADAATVVRQTATTWLVTATERAELLSWGHTGIQRRSGPSHEGQYILPFEITISAPTAPGHASCTP